MDNSRSNGKVARRRILSITLPSQRSLSFSPRSINFLSFSHTIVLILPFLSQTITPPSPHDWIRPSRASSSTTTPNSTSCQTSNPITAIPQNGVLSARQNLSLPPSRPLQSMRNPPSHRLDLNNLSRWQNTQPSTLLPIHQPNLRSTIRNVQRQPNLRKHTQRHNHQCRILREILLEPRHLQTERSCQHQRRTNTLRRR